MEHHFVGDTNKAAVIEKLDMGSSHQQVIYLGLHGMGGIGKSTLTKLIYNEFLPSFDYCAFLPDIREFSANEGINNLPSHLSKNLQPKFVEPVSRSDQIPNQFRNKKVLLILDDVDSDEQIKNIAREASWFGSGSRIILTSRDKKVFQDFEAKSSRCDFRYLEMEELDHGLSLELFSRCAFGKVSPPLPYKDLSKRAIASAGGLPLAITVVAKQLRNRNEGVWEEIIGRLKKTPPKEVKARLLISYESLEDEHKTIFLDIACLFSRWGYSEESSIFYMWEACGLYPRWSLEVLQSRSLVKVVKGSIFDESKFYFRIHDQLRDLGRDIVIDKSGRDLTKQSMLWEEHEVLEVLKCKEKQKNMIEAICLNEGNTYEGVFMVSRDEEFVSFDNLRFLHLIRSKLRGDFSNLFPKLRYLSCCYIIEARNLAPPNLVILDLSRSDVDENWGGWKQILVLKKLKVLLLWYCMKLQRTPVFPKNMPLEILDLRNCWDLEYIDTSIGKLQQLTQLNLSECHKLKKLPDSIGGLGKLKDLNLTFCELLVELPKSFGNLHSLRNLRLACAKNLSKVPDLSYLQDLNSLWLNGCQMLTMIPGLVNLKRLREFDIEGCRLSRELLEVASRLKKLPGVEVRGIPDWYVDDSDRIPDWYLYGIPDWYLYGIPDGLPGLNWCNEDEHGVTMDRTGTSANNELLSLLAIIVLTIVILMPIYGRVFLSQ